jgi:hypothetical protein
MAADEEENYVVAQANTPIDENGKLKDSRVLVRRSPQAMLVMMVMSMPVNVRMTLPQWPMPVLGSFAAAGGPQGLPTVPEQPSADADDEQPTRERQPHE